MCSREFVFILVTSLLGLCGLHCRPQRLANDGGNSLEEPEIRMLHVDTDIQHRYAVSKVTSQVANPARSPQEVSFTLTIPETAFISNFSMVVGGKEYVGYVKKKEEAKEEYDKAVSAGQTAGHVALNPRESNRFTVSVNVRPEEKVLFTLIYEELLQRKLGEYECVVNVDPGQIVKDLKVKIKIHEKTPIKNVRVPKLRESVELLENEVDNEIATVEQPTPNTCIIIYAPTVEQQLEASKNGIQGQFVVKYDVEREMSGELLSIDGYFVYFMAPPIERPLPKYVTFVLDTSGSMTGRKMEQLKEAMTKILDELRPGDFFSIVEFDATVDVWNPNSGPIPVTPESVQEAKQFVYGLNADGGTNIQDALRVGLGLARRVPTPDTVPLLIFLTDGLGFDPELILQETAVTNQNPRVSIYSLAFGDDADYNFLKKLSLQNQGFSRKIYEASDAVLQLTNFYRELSTPLIRNVTVTYADNEVEDLTATQTPTFFKGQEFVTTGKLKNPKATTLSVVVQGISGDGLLNLSPDMTLLNENPAKQPEGKFGNFMKRLFIFLHIKDLMRKRDATNDPRVIRECEIDASKLALDNNFVTPLTSLVVVKPDQEQSVNPIETVNDIVVKPDDQFAFQPAPQSSPGSIRFGILNGRHFVSVLLTPARGPTYGVPYSTPVTFPIPQNGIDPGLTENPFNVIAGSNTEAEAPNIMMYPDVEIEENEVNVPEENDDDNESQPEDEMGVTEESSPPTEESNQSQDEEKAPADDKLPEDNPNEVVADKEQSDEDTDADANGKPGVIFTSEPQIPEVIDPETEAFNEEVQPEDETVMMTYPPPEDDNGESANTVSETPETDKSNDEVERPEDEDGKPKDQTTEFRPVEDEPTEGASEDLPEDETTETESPPVEDVPEDEPTEAPSEDLPEDETTETESPPVEDVPEDEITESPPVEDVPEDETTESPPVEDIPEDETTESPPGEDVPEDEITESPPGEDVRVDETTESPPEEDVPEDETTESPPGEDVPEDVITESPPEKALEDEITESPPEEDVPEDETTEFPPVEDVPKDETTESPPEADVPEDESAESPAEENKPEDETEETPPQEDIAENETTESYPEQDEATKSPPEEDKPEVETTESPSEEDKQEDGTEGSLFQDDIPEDETTESSAEENIPENETDEAPPQEDVPEGETEETPPQEDVAENGTTGSSPEEDEATESPAVEDIPEDETEESPAEENKPEDETDEAPPQEDKPADVTTESPSVEDAPEDEITEAPLVDDPEDEVTAEYPAVEDVSEDEAADSSPEEENPEDETTEIGNEVTPSATTELPIEETTTPTEPPDDTILLLPPLSTRELLIEEILNAYPEHPFVNYLQDNDLLKELPESQLLSLRFGGNSTPRPSMGFFSYSKPCSGDPADSKCQHVLDACDPLWKNASVPGDFLMQPGAEDLRCGPLEELFVSDEEKVSILSGISLSSLASQVAECQHMLHLLQPYLSEPTPLIDHWQSLAQTSPHTEPVFSLVHYLPKSRHERVRLRPSSPRVISPTPSKRPLQSEMNLYTLCQWGVLPALWILHRAHLRFKPSRVALQMRQFSTPPNSSLSFGPFSVLSLPDEDGASSDQNPLSEDSQNSILAWLRNNDVLGANNDSSRNSALWNSGPPDPPVEPSEDFPGMPLPTDFVDLVSYLNKRVKITEKRPPPSSRGPTLWSTRELNLEEEEVAHADDDLLRSVEVATKAQTISHLETDPHSISHLSSPNCPRVASVPFRGCPVSLAEHLDHITPGMSGHRICTFFRRNPSVFTHLVYSLLIGRPVVIAGHEDAQFTVRERVNALEIFLPWSPKKRDGYSDGNYSSQILRWHHGTVVSHHLSEYKIIGLCVPERLNVQDMMSSATLNQVTVLSVKTDHLSGPAYSGRLLAPLLLPIRPMFLTDAALLSQLLAIAFSIAGKLYLLHAVTSEGRLKIQRVLTSLGTEGSCDRLMLKYLLGLIRNETLVSLEAA
ncbi:unnamed protein product [Cyprideis torosa]|uniref:Uncharacterized protein n=1 Tax=Cyprideis torosa TaxID=163714 RepID=A0A7R8W7Y9_9CRUS|nr:unnamed protein product [Cyprideis torosa]CAG0886870.1 unnamed protein product [Cyprideis torosa]